MQFQFLIGCYAVPGFDWLLCSSSFWLVVTQKLDSDWVARLSGMYENEAADAGDQQAQPQAVLSGKVWTP